MFVNGCLSAPSVSVKANSINIDGASGIPFLSTSGYKYVTAGSGVNLTFFLGNTNTPLANQAENMIAPGHYTAFLGGTISEPIYLFTTDDLTPPAPGNVKLRFVNLSPDNINETATVNDTIVTQGIAVNTISSFYQVRSGSSYITVYDPVSKNMVVHTDTVALLPGKIYTVLLTGTLADSLTLNGLLLSLIKNN